MFCPKCKTKYRKGITICPDCSAPLVEQLESEKEAYADEEDYDRALELLEVFEDTEDDLPLS